MRTRGACQLEILAFCKDNLIIFNELQAKNITPDFLLHFWGGNALALARVTLSIRKNTKALADWEWSDHDEFSQASSASDIVLGRMEASANGGNLFFR